MISPARRAIRIVFSSKSAALSTANPSQIQSRLTTKDYLYNLQKNFFRYFFADGFGRPQRKGRRVERTPAQRGKAAAFRRICRGNSPPDRAQSADGHRGREGVPPGRVECRSGRATRKGNQERHGARRKH